MEKTYYVKGEPNKIAVKRESVQNFKIDMEVYHEKIYDGNERMKIVGIRAHEIELEGDYSGGTHKVTQKDWMPIEGIFRLRKVCEETIPTGSCPHHNLHCAHPKCEPYV